jgi:hypothetical protein
MKKIFFTILCCLFVAIAFPQYITLKGKQLYDQSGNPFYVKGINYTVELFNASGLLSSFQLKPSYGYYPTSKSSYYTDTASIKDIMAHWRIIRDSMGCNTIRLCVGWAGAPSCDSNFFNGYVTTSGAPPWSTHKLVHTTNLSYVVPIYKQLLDSAAALNIKIILLLWGEGASCDNNSTLQTIYQNYLDTVANALKTKTALLAYDEWNEPEQSNLGRWQRKDVVCNYSSQWYTNMKSFDPNHLITVGLWGPDVTNWGVDVYKVDFFSVHIYPNTSKAIHYTDTSGNYVVDSVLDYNNVTAYNEKFNTNAIMMANTCNRPWLIGETSFGANMYPDYTHKDTANYYKKADGDLNAQTSYLLNTLTTVKQLGGMGCLWWCFKDGISPMGINPEDPADDFFGLIDNGSGHVKAAGYAIKNFNANSVSGPAPNYPSDFQNLNGHAGTAISGHVVSSTGGGVHDAYVTGWHYGVNPSIGKVQNAWADNIPSDASGNYTIVSTTPPFPFTGSSTIINNMEVGAAGCNLVFSRLSDTLQGKTFTLSKAYYYDFNTPSVSLSANVSYAPVAAPDINTLPGFTITASTGGTVYTASVTAGREIQILPQGTSDSYVAQTAEAAFYITPTDVECGDAVFASQVTERKAQPGTAPQSHQASINNIAPQANETVALKTIYLSPESFLLQVYPNPATDMVLLQSVKSINLVTLCNMYGATVAQYNLQGAQQQSININTLTPGTYIIKILYNDNTTTYTQIIKQ